MYVVHTLDSLGVTMTGETFLYLAGKYREQLAKMHYLNFYFDKFV